MGFIFLIGGLSGFRIMVLQFIFCQQNAFHILVAVAVAVAVAGCLVA
jgi:hypothetical protein